MNTVCLCAASDPVNRVSPLRREVVDDGWEPVDEDDQPPPVATRVTSETAKSIVSRNDSPDIPFTCSIIPYRGCEHGCVYRYARPSHGSLDLSPSRDFETRFCATRSEPRTSESRHHTVPATRAAVQRQRQLDLY